MQTFTEFAIFSTSGFQNLFLYRKLKVSCRVTSVLAETTVTLAFCIKIKKVPFFLFSAVVKPNVLCIPLFSLVLTLHPCHEEPQDV